MLHRIGAYEEARTEYQRSLASVSTRQRHWRGRLYRKIGVAWSDEREYNRAMEAFDHAEQALGPQPTVARTEWTRAWLEIQPHRINGHYYRHDLDSLLSIVERTRPLVEQQGTIRQQADFFKSLLMIALRRDRYVISEETMALSLSYLAATEQLESPSDAAWGRFNVGFCRLLRGELEEAQHELQAALDFAERAGDVLLRSRCLNYLTMTARRRGNVEQAEKYLARSTTAAAAAGTLEYLAQAAANRAWLTWRRGHVPEASRVAAEALRTMRDLPIRLPFEWLATWPLLHIALHRDDIAEAVEYANGLLAPSQQPPPPSSAAALERAIQAWDADRPLDCRNHLRHATDLARRLHYL